MSKFLVGDVRAKIGRRKHVRHEQQPGPEMNRSGATSGKLPRSDRNGGSAARYGPSRATRALLARRLQDIREQKGLSQSDVSSLMAIRRAYISRVEDAKHTPTLRILHRWASVLGVPLYQFFYDGKTPHEQLRVSELQTTAEVAANGSHDRYFRELWRLLPRLGESNRRLLLQMAQTIYRRKPRGVSLGRREAMPRAIAG